MGRYTIIQGQELEVYLESDSQDNGWIVGSGIATHESCNSGYIKNGNFVAEPGKEYKVTYTVFNRTSGSVFVSVGGTTGQYISQNGTFSELIVAGSGDLRFWSDGDLSIRDVIISDGVIPGSTISFNTDNMQWVGYKSFVPEYMTRFLDGFYTFKDGKIWKNNANELRNNFFGEQYPSIIKFYVNLQPSAVKNFYNIRLKSNKAWAITEIEIPPREGKSKGQKSRLKKGRFKSYQGDWFADFLRDMTDPRFVNELDALVNGALLQGSWMEITMENNDTGEVRMSSVDVHVDIQNFSY